LLYPTFGSGLGIRRRVANRQRGLILRDGAIPRTLDIQYAPEVEVTPSLNMRLVP
jgi:hypothetical protein